MSDANGRLSALRTVGAFLRKGACSETLFHVLNGAYGEPMPAEEHGSAPLAGGLLMHGYQCGQTWGAALAAGARVWRKYGAGARAEATAIAAAERLIAAFRAQTGHIDCFDITDLDAQSSKSIVRILAHMAPKGGPVLCFRMAARFAPVAAREIDSALAREDDGGVPPLPVSCAALVARKMGATEQQAVTAAGLAGGIGLSGGGCGALGAAIWISETRAAASDGKRRSRFPEAAALIERFLKCTKYEFECTAIVGRTFDNVADHAQHVCAGGCSKIMDALAAS